MFKKETGQTIHCMYKKTSKVHPVLTSSMFPATVTETPSSIPLTHILEHIIGLTWCCLFEFACGVNKEDTQCDNIPHTWDKEAYQCATAFQLLFVFIIVMSDEQVWLHYRRHRPWHYSEHSYTGHPRHIIQVIRWLWQLCVILCKKP